MGARCRLGASRSQIPSPSPSTSPRRTGQQLEPCYPGAEPGPASGADLLWMRAGELPGHRDSSKLQLLPPAVPSGDLGVVGVGNSSDPEAQLSLDFPPHPSEHRTLAQGNPGEGEPGAHFHTLPAVCQP